jgi:hypothetical protein
MFPSDQHFAAKHSDRGPKVFFLSSFMREIVHTVQPPGIHHGIAQGSLF